MTTVILVPRRADGGWRDQVWGYCRRRWETADLPIIEGIDNTDQPFNRSATINAASAAAGRWDVAVIIDADVVYRTEDWDALDETINLANDKGILVLGYRRRLNLTGPISKRLVNGWPVKIDGHVQTELAAAVSSCLAVPRDLWDQVGGFDERFQGWGWEDVAFHRACRMATGQVHRVDADLLHLWHPRPQQRISGMNDPRFAANKELGQRYKDAATIDDMLAILHEPGAPLCQ